jgi:hypothetical protein
MTTALAMFVRRSTAAGMTLVYLVVLIAVAVTRDTWMYNALTAINWVTGGLLMALPIVVGASAFDAWRFHRGQWRQTLLPTMRPVRSLGMLATVHMAAICVAWLALCCVAICVTLVNGANLQVSAAMLAQPALLCAFAAAAGVTLGALIPRAWIAPAAAVGFFALTLIAENYGPYRRFLMALGFPGWTPYTRLDPTLLSLKCIALGLLIMGCAVLWHGLGAPPAMRRGSRAGAAVLLGAALVTVTVAGSMQAPGSNGLVQTAWNGELECTNGTIKFCTNEPATLSTPFSAAVEAAYANLAQYGITPPAAFVDERTVANGEPQVGLWAVDPTYLVGGTPTPDATALSVSRPAACAAYFANTPSPEDDRLLDASGLVFDFVFITETSRATGDDPAVVWIDWHPSIPWATIVDTIGQNYDAVSSCDASALPSGVP